MSAVPGSHNPAVFPLSTHLLNPLWSGLHLSTIGLLFHLFSSHFFHLHAPLAISSELVVQQAAW